MNIEVEIRGKIEKFEKILERFRQKANFLGEKNRISFIYFREDIDETDLSSIKDEQVDLRVRITNKLPEIVMKYGTWGVEENRREFSFPIEIEKFNQAIEFFKCLGWKRGVLVDTKTYLFEYKCVEFALVKSGNFSYFEAEKIITDENKISPEKQKIKEIIKEMGLIIFTEKEFIQMIEAMNKRKDRLFNMEKDNFEEIKEKFKDYF
jgi:adenylate cyclase class IV